MRLVFPEVRLTAVRIVWQPPEEPNGVILGKEWRERARDLFSPVSIRQWGRWTQTTTAAAALDTEHHRPPWFLSRALRLSRAMKFTFY